MSETFTLKHSSF